MAEALADRVGITAAVEVDRVAGSDRADWAAEVVAADRAA
jgi:hypothetical protein